MSDLTTCGLVCDWKVSTLWLDRGSRSIAAATLGKTWAKSGLATASRIAEDVLKCVWNLRRPNMQAKSWRVLFVFAVLVVAADAQLLRADPCGMVPPIYPSAPIMNENGDGLCFSPIVATISWSFPSTNSVRFFPSKTAAMWTLLKTSGRRFAARSSELRMPTINHRTNTWCATPIVTDPIDSRPNAPTRR